MEWWQIVLAVLAWSGLGLGALIAGKRYSAWLRREARNPTWRYWSIVTVCGPGVWALMLFIWIVAVAIGG